jgi:hypothetical protein
LDRGDDHCIALVDDSRKRGTTAYAHAIATILDSAAAITERPAWTLADTELLAFGKRSKKKVWTRGFGASLPVSNIVPFRATGPRTDRGKRIASVNALRHGLYASTVVVRGIEDEDDYRRFARQIVIELDVDGALEMALAERVISTLWRLRRVRRFEVEQLSREGDEAAALLKQAEEQDKIVETCQAEAAAMLCIAYDGYHRGSVPYEKLQLVEDALVRVIGEDPFWSLYSDNMRLFQILERKKGAHLNTVREAFHEVVLSCIRAGAIAWKLDASRSYYAICILFEVESVGKAAEKRSRELRQQARARQVAALLLLDDESERGPQQARTIADVERRLERQLSRALDDFWKHRGYNADALHQPRRSGRSS